MEKKITIILFIVVLAIFSCMKKSVYDSKITNTKEHDTIYFGSDKSFMQYRDSFLLENTSTADHYVVFQSVGKGKSIWIDSLLYINKQQSKIAVIVHSLDYGYCLIYYNGDSLTHDIISINTPIVRECVANSFKIINITDSLFNSGILTKSQLFYRIENNGVISDKKSYFAQKIENKFDFTINMVCNSHSVIILKNGYLEHEYK